MTAQAQSATPKATYRFAVVVGLAAVSLSAPAPAQVTVAAVDCAHWIEARNTDAVAFEHYMRGMVDGISLGAKVDVWGVRKLRQEQYYLWIDNWCRDNPFGTLATAGLSFVDEVTGGPVGIFRD